MANDQAKGGYPVMPIKHWWALRRKFQTSIPGTVTTTYLAAALNMTEPAAQTNVMPSLKRTGLIDENGKPTALANDWRNDAKYPEVCEKVRKSVYPQEIQDLASDTSAERGQVSQWFASHTGAGRSAATKMAAFYLMLLQADPATESVSASKTPHLKTKQVSTTTAQKELQKNRTGAGKLGQGSQSNQSLAGLPPLHLNVQIHLSPEATPEQIERIFAAMAKYLKETK